jgi:hypothetical protein
VDIPCHAGYAQLLAYVGAGPAAAHRVQNEPWLEVEQQVLDKITEGRVER